MATYRLPPPYSAHAQDGALPETRAGHVVDGDVQAELTRPPCYVSEAPPEYETLPRRGQRSRDGDEGVTVSLLQDNTDSSVTPTDDVIARSTDDQTSHSIACAVTPCSVD